MLKEKFEYQNGFLTKLQASFGPFEVFPAEVGYENIQSLYGFVKDVCGEISDVHIETNYNRMPKTKLTVFGSTAIENKVIVKIDIRQIYYEFREYINQFKDDENFNVTLNIDFLDSNMNRCAASARVSTKMPKVIPWIEANFGSNNVVDKFLEATYFRVTLTITEVDPYKDAL